MKIETRCVQSGYTPKNGEPRVLPITQSTTFVYDTPEQMGDLFDLKAEGFFYTRLGNPTVDALEKKLAAIDGGIGTICTASGMAAVTNLVMTLCKAGDNIISSSTIYGGTYNLFSTTFPKFGIETRFIDVNAKNEDYQKLIDEKTKFIFCETIANPAMTVPDFERIAKVAHENGIPLVCDNTLATGIIFDAFKHGVDFNVYSTTKYVDGHATSVGGAIVDSGNFNFLGNKRFPDFNEPDPSYHGLVYAKDFGKMGFLIKSRCQIMRDTGAQLSAFNAFCTVLGLETLHLRMPQHSKNALAVAELLKESDAVEWVKYAGLKTDANYELAQKYFNNGMASGMVTFGIKGGREAASKFQKALKLFKIVTHIADSRSCVLHPASTTHRQLSDSDLIACGISDNLIRLSCGTEATEDIVEDIKNALIASQK
ncbi:MAG: O-acetylhomoserine aminocarboxypropyltransferase/cysteine synthase [Clostridia bacterium]|nr:O-acetylhomoserine aminocarboxypropyltransferase/cysteine synthase [Clostridia bacterium]